MNTIKADEDQGTQDERKTSKVFLGIMLIFLICNIPKVIVDLHFLITDKWIFYINYYPLWVKIMEFLR